VSFIRGAVSRTHFPALLFDLLLVFAALLPLVIIGRTEERAENLSLLTTVGVGGFWVALADLLLLSRRHP